MAAEGKHVEAKENTKEQPSPEAENHEQTDQA